MMSSFITIDDLRRRASELANLLQSFGIEIHIYPVVPRSALARFVALAEVLLEKYPVLLPLLLGKSVLSGGYRGRLSLNIAEPHPLVETMVIEFPEVVPMRPISSLHAILRIRNLIMDEFAKYIRKYLARKYKVNVDENWLRSSLKFSYTPLKLRIVPSAIELAKNYEDVVPMVLEAVAQSARVSKEEVTRNVLKQLKRYVVTRLKDLIELVRPLLSEIKERTEKYWNLIR